MEGEKQVFRYHCPETRASTEKNSLVQQIAVSPPNDESINFMVLIQVAVDHFRFVIGFVTSAEERVRAVLSTCDQGQWLLPLDKRGDVQQMDDTAGTPYETS